MSNYVKTTNFAAKDSLPSGDPGKIIRGTEFNVEFDHISASITSKANSSNPTFTGQVTVGDLTVTGDVVMMLGDSDTVTINGGNY